MADANITLNELAAKVTELSEALTRQLAEKKIPAPTFAPDSPVKYTGITEEIFVTRQKLADVLNDMWYLSQGPSESVYNYVHNVSPSCPALLRTAQTAQTSCGPDRRLAGYGLMEN